MRRLCPAITLLVCCLSVSVDVHADRRYFVQNYTPYLAPAGNLELENWVIAKAGQGDSTGTSWKNRVEFEYAASDRLTGAFYLNFVQPAGFDAPMSFDGPSVELIYQLAPPGRLAVDPAAYFEIRANGNEVELEPKLLLARRVYRLVGALNVIGEFERINAGEERGTWEKNLLVTAGLSREIGNAFAVGLESTYERGLSEGGEHPSSLLLGPTVNYQTSKIQVTLGWHPQITGSPDTHSGLNLDDFPRSEIRMIVGVDL